MDILFILNGIITFLLSHQILTYLILFIGPLFVYEKIFFLVGSIFAGTGILNVWIVILILYFGGLLRDNISYFLGKKYGLSLYQYLETKNFLKKYINETNYEKGLKFFKKYKKHSVFFPRFIGPVFSWIIPFLAGINKLNYKTFLKYNLPAVILSIGQFAVIGYFIGIYHKILLDLFFKYLFVLLFAGVVFVFLYIYLKSF